MAGMRGGHEADMTAGQRTAAALEARQREFIDRHWPRADAPRGGRRDGRLPAWDAALEAVGWGLAHWPRAHGGPGWGLRERHRWECLCAAAGIPQRSDDAGVLRVAPVVWTFGSRQLRNAWLPVFARRQARWAVAAGAHAVTLHRTAGAAHLEGDAGVVSDAGEATWLALPVCDRSSHANAVAWLALEQPGVRFRQVTMLDGRAATRVTLDAAVAAATLPGTAAVARLLAPGLDELALAPRLQRAVGQLRQWAAAQGSDDGTGSLLHSATFSRRLALLEVEVLGLAAAEAQLLSRPATDPWLDPEAVRRRRWQAARCAVHLGDVIDSVFGYHALPWLADAAFDNEPAPGPPGAVAALAELQRIRAQLTPVQVPSRDDLNAQAN